MHTKLCYYSILIVYILLWTCQLIAGHLTHSLVILVDSYINIYKILDISLGILHLRTQFEIRKERTNCLEGNTKEAKDGIKLFGRDCTFQFKRLPVLGSFVNGLFLAAVLVSAAIEGVQTCFHVSHLSNDGSKSILFDHPIIYPGLLLGFALVGIMMQWCSSKAHDMREDELDSESRLCLNEEANGFISELDVTKLPNEPGDVNLNMTSICSVYTNDKKSSKVGGNHREKKSYREQDQLKFSPAQRGFESIPLDSGGDSSQISLKSIKIPATSEYKDCIKIDSMPIENNDQILRSQRVDLWLMIRYCMSPLALIISAIIVYFINDEVVTEIADAGLAVLVVILLFSASYPPMKKAALILLQSSPDQVDLQSLEEKIKSVSPLIEEVKDLHVWSLTSRSNRVATCLIVLDKDYIHSEEIISVLIRDVKSKFLDNNIKCSAVEPLLSDRSSTQTESIRW